MGLGHFFTETRESPVQDPAVSLTNRLPNIFFFNAAEHRSYEEASSGPPCAASAASSVPAHVSFLVPPQGTEVKAITYSAMQILEDEKPEVFVIIDI